MANVIPLEMRRAVRRASRARFIFVGSVVALLCAGLSFIVLLPSYFALTVNAAGTASASNLSQESSRDKATITSAKALLSELSPLVVSTSTPTDAIRSALSLLPTGVHVDEITYVSGKPASLTLVGSAATTGDIGAYKSALAADPLFSAVSIPVGALVGTDGGRFSVSLSGMF